MANGLLPWRYKSGKEYNGAGNTFYKSTTANTNLFVGDPIIRIASTDANGYPEMQRATAGAACTGHIIGVYLNKNDLTKAKYIGSADTGYVIVCDDPDVLLIGLEGGSGTALAVSQIGKHINASVNNGSTTTQTSGCYLDNNAVATGNTYRIEYMGEAVAPGNTIGSATHKVVVAVNKSTEVNAGASNLSETA